MGLKDLFFKNDNEEKEVPEEKAVNSPGKFVAGPPNPTILGIQDNRAITAQNPTNVVDNEILDMFDKVLESRNLSGNDYFEFRKSVILMKDIPLDEKNKFISTFRTLQASDKTLDKKKLIDSINYYLNVLEEERKNFENAKETNLNTNVTSKFKEVEANNNQIADLVKQINEINEAITALQSKNQVLNQEANENQIKITQKTSNFDFTYNHLVDELQNDLNKINNYIN